MDSRVFRTAIIGLGRSDVLALHNTFDHLIASHQFEWVTADHPQLDFLLVNSFFITSTSIKKLIATHNIPYLIVDRQESPLTVEQETLHLPIKETHTLKQWVQQHIWDRHTSNASQAASVGISDSSPLKSKNVPVRSSSIIEKKNQHLPRCSNEHSLLEIVHQILEIKQGKWLLQDAQQTIALLDLSTSLVWLKLDQPITKLDIHLPLQLKETYQTLPDSTPCDLRQWLWQLAWHCESESMLLPRHIPVAIKLWPQPFDQSIQNILLKGCAFLKYHTASAEQLSQAIQITVTEAQKLLTSMVAVDFAEEAVAGFNQPQPIVSQVSSPSTVQDKPLKGFLSRLRHKLGF